MKNDVLHIKFVDDNKLILKMPRGGLWTCGDGYVVLRAPMVGLS